MCQQKITPHTWHLKSDQSVTSTFFWRIRIRKIIRFSKITEYQISNTILHWENPNTEYRILFGIEKIVIPNRNSTIWSYYSNTKYNFFFGKNATKINIFVSYKTFCFKFFWNYSNRYLDQYSNTQILFGVPKKIKYQLPNTTIWSNYSTSIWIPNICHILHLTCDTWHVKCDTCWGWTFCKTVSSLVFTVLVMIFLRLGGNKWVAYGINESWMIEWPGVAGYTRSVKKINNYSDMSHWY